MKTILLLLLSLIVFSSCSKYQCVSISSENTIRNERNEFVIDNDSLHIAYNFDGKHGTVQVSIFNKSSKILGVNWARSFVIVGENPSAFFDPVVRVEGLVENTSRSSLSASVTATADQPQELQFIPPQATINRNGISLANGGLFDVRKYDFKEEYVKVLGIKKKMRRAKVSRSDSPLQFRIFITVLPGGERSAEPIIFDNYFYASELISTKGEAPVIFPVNQNRNMIIMRKSTTTGALLKVGATIGIIALLVAAG